MFKLDHLKVMHCILLCGICGMLEQDRINRPWFALLDVLLMIPLILVLSKE